MEYTLLKISSQKEISIRFWNAPILDINASWNEEGIYNAYISILKIAITYHNYAKLPF